MNINPSIYTYIYIKRDYVYIQVIVIIIIIAKIYRKFFDFLKTCYQEILPRKTRADRSAQGRSASRPRRGRNLASQA